jgi:predicted transport protein
MALGPKQMGEAILRNLEDKTGKTLEQWLTLVKKSKLADKKQVIDFLKSEHNLGHFQAQKIYECFSETNIYAETDRFIPNLFNSAELLKAYKKIEATLLKMGKDVRVQPCKTYIPFYRTNQFCIVKASKDKKITIGLNLPSDFKTDLFKKAKTVASERINYQTTLESIADFDAQLIEIIKIAYSNN